MARLIKELGFFSSGLIYVPFFDSSLDSLVSAPKILETPIEEFMSEATSHSVAVPQNNDSKPTEQINILNCTMSILRICSQYGNFRITSGALYMICRVWSYAIIASLLDHELLATVHRSWSTDRLRAIRQYEKAAGIDRNELDIRVAKMFEDWLD